jgi:dTDP-4-amino-4,6-dideoxygalactose transaminase
MHVPFGDLKRQYDANRAEYDAAVHRVLDSGWFILGKELEAFEADWAVYVGADFAVGCGSGTEAIHLALWAHGIGPGDRVVTVPNTCVPTVAGIRLAGATIALCDVDPDTGMMDHRALDTELKRNPAKAVVPVHLYGQPAGISLIAGVAARHNVALVDDAAQAHGAVYRGRRVGAQGFLTCWSFYPSKNLGAFGDAGAVTTHSEEMATRLRKLRNYGQERRYFHSDPGTNSRLDEMQAAVLRVKLAFLDQWNERRRAIAQRYRQEIVNPAIRFLTPTPDSTGCGHLFPVFFRERDLFVRMMAETGVECLIHYPVPVHLQGAYGDLGYRRGDFPNAERLCGEVVSLPLFPELTDAEVSHVIASANSVQPD